MQPRQSPRSISLWKALGWKSLNDVVKSVPALGIMLAALGFVIVETHLALRYHVYLINIDVRYLVIASVVALFVAVFAGLIASAIFFAVGGPIGLALGIVIGLALGVVVGGPLAAPASDVILVFKEDIAASGLPLPIDPVNPKRTQLVRKVIDVTDGVLVQDELTGTVITVRNDLLSGVVEKMAARAVPSPTPTTTIVPLTPTSLVPSPTP
ncbi:MAG: hypothetical protein IT324_06170 [Anaerolineae bacterium]|nr:hypothetical protein [Anaerolineae bacterium]